MRGRGDDAHHQIIIYFVIWTSEDFYARIHIASTQPEEAGGMLVEIAFEIISNCMKFH